MSTRQRPGDIGASDARRLAGLTGAEIRNQRLLLGVSQRAVAVRAGMSLSEYARLERQELERPSLDILCRGARAVGLAPSLGWHPTGELVRDSAQLALLDRFAALLGAPLTLRREVPLPIRGDRRAWDGRIVGGSAPASVEGESRLHDLQALARRLALKLRDDPGAGILLLVVNRTAHNHRVLAAHREGLRDLLPLDGNAVIRPLRRGELPAANGIVLL